MKPEQTNPESSFWDSRYESQEYAYGIKPNEFLKSVLANQTTGTLLLPAEGEGRNAVYAASLGWSVLAFDRSIQGKMKAEQLAQKVGVNFTYILNDFENIQLANDSFDLAALIYHHIPTSVRQKIFNKYWSSIKQGGSLVMEGFSQKQLQYNSGGPKNIDMLYDETIVQYFPQAIIHQIETCEIVLDEGPFHQGPASVIRMHIEKTK
ncbi:MAG: methyltransferase domain-containing protein [Bacteroidetes bacterium]|nr:methyltransferase domain-containing protein [Bacteroidota bacterium]